MGGGWGWLASSTFHAVSAKIKYLLKTSLSNSGRRIFACYFLPENSRQTVCQILAPPTLEKSSRALLFIDIKLQHTSIIDQKISSFAQAVVEILKLFSIACLLTHPLLKDFSITY
jgi:hypothetical protein